MAKQTTTTGYLILGLLATRDWTAYELAEQLSRGVTELWPRVERQMYNAPKRLVEDGLVATRQEKAEGARTRTVYSITKNGRKALADWLSTETAPPALAYEGMVRVLLASEGTTDDLRSTITTMAEQARESRDYMIGMARLLRADDEDERDLAQHNHVFALVNRFTVDHFDNMLRWATWALAEIDDWPDTTDTAKTQRARTNAIFDRVIAVGESPDGEPHVRDDPAGGE